MGVRGKENFFTKKFSFPRKSSLATAPCTPILSKTLRRGFAADVKDIVARIIDNPVRMYYNIGNRSNDKKHLLSYPFVHGFCFAATAVNEHKKLIS